MKKISRHFTTTTGILTCLAAILIATSAQAAQTKTVSFSDTHTVGSAYTDFYLGKFNAGLGTLTAVQVTVDFSTLAGSISLTNPDVGAATVLSFDSTVTVKGTGLGYATSIVAVEGVVTTPDWKTTVIAGGGTQVFTIAGGQNAITNSTQTIGSGFFSAYMGSDTVAFQARDVQGVSTSGSSYTMNATAAGASTKMTVTYTYDAVPEPTTIGLLAVAGGVILLAVRRRRA